MQTDRFTDVPGIAIGHAHDAAVRTGVTVIVPHAPVVMAADIRGGGPGTRETDALKPHTLVERVHALVLAGGSVFGLGAADALANALSARGIGLDMGVRHVPVVPAAILFDLGNGGDKGWAVSPYPALALAALEAVGQDDINGTCGAGFGATAGSRAGGIGSASVMWEGFTIGALIAANSFGEVYPGAPPEGDVPMPKLARSKGIVGQNTCIGAVATDAPLTRAQAERLAMMAQDGLARAIRPIHTPFDGDSIFALSTAVPGLAPVDPVQLTVLGTLAADMVARAVRRAVFCGN